MKYFTEAYCQYRPAAVFVGFSGGGDSLLCLHLMRKYYPAKAFHANTGIGIEATRQFCRDYCKKHSVKFVEIRAKEDCGQDYDQMVIEQGFPGPAMHGKMYQRLKERPIRELHRRYKQRRGGKIMMLTGIRYDESQVRAGYKDRIIDVVNGVVWVNPVYFFSGQEKYDWLNDHGIERNPVSEIIGMSGECLCGAFASKGELEMVRLIEPETAERIEALQERVYEAGHRWPWHGKPLKTHILEKHGQQNMFFCHGCGKKNGVSV
jgi:3'-phosphoadenosine 5'-phosphosulfate sulfotransferase (PAPS reductase)/FAD synthetase